MTSTIIVFAALAACLLVALAGAAAAAQTALTRISRSRADALLAAEVDNSAEEQSKPDPRVGQLHGQVQRPVNSVAPLVMLELAAEFTVVTVAVVAGYGRSGWPGAALAGSIASFTIFLVVVSARSRALLSADAMAVRFAPFAGRVAKLGQVAIAVARFARRGGESNQAAPDVDEQELLAIAGQAEAFDEGEEQLIKRVVAFDDTTVNMIMTPRTDLVTLRSGFAVKDALEVASMHGLSRLPLTRSESDIDDILGVVHVKDLIIAYLDGRDSEDVDNHTRPVPLVPETQRIANLLSELRSRRFHMAIAVDEYGGVAGLVTLEDVLEELVGEIEDEFDLEEILVEPIDQRSARFDGRAEIQLVEDSLGLALPVGDYRTVAGFFFATAGRVPEPGDVVTTDELRLTVLEMDGRRIASILITLADRDGDHSVPHV